MVPTSNVAAKSGSRLRGPMRVSDREHGERGPHAPVRDRDGRDVDERVERKDDEEEGPEVVKHLDEKVPREANVGRQVGDRQAGARERQRRRGAKGMQATHMTP